MIRPRFSALLGTLVLLTAPTRAARAVEAPAAPSAGPLCGISVGVGGGVLDYVFWDTPFASERGAGGALGLHVARALDREFALGLRGLAWTRSFENVYGDDETWTFSLGAIVLTWRPAGRGFFVRGGPGWGRAELEFDYGDAKVVGAESGPLALLGCGWTWRIAGGLALGPTLEIGAIRLAEAWRADLGTLSLELSWQP